jgi:hypothetical protein
VGGVIQPNTIASVPLPLAANIKKRMLIFRNSTYIISDWFGDEFPNVLYIRVRDIPGYHQIDYTDFTGIPLLLQTNRVAAL